MKQTVFISYSSLDQDKVDYLVREFKNNSSFKPLVIAFNREPTKPLTEKVVRGIKDCFCIIPILTSNSIKTQWINQEIGFAKGIGKEIIPIVDSNIINELKGFIHKQIDLPYNYKSNIENKTTENKRFVKTVRTLISDLEKKKEPNEEVKVKSKFEENIEIAEKLNSEKKFEKKRSKFLSSKEAFEQAENEVQFILNDIETKIKQIEEKEIYFRKETSFYDPILFIFGVERYSCSFMWIKTYNDNLEGAILNIQYWKGYATTMDDPLYTSEEDPQALKSYKFKFDIDVNDKIGWFNEVNNSFYSSTEVVDDSFEWILSKIKKK